MEPNERIELPDQPGVYPTLTAVEPGVKISLGVTAPLARSKDVEPPVVMANPPGLMLADAVNPKSVHGNGPADWLVVP